MDQTDVPGSAEVDLSSRVLPDTRLTDAHLTDPGAVARRRRRNRLTGATPLGRWLARRHVAALVPGPYGLELALGYPRRFPATRATAVCVGDVVLLRRSAEQAAARPRLLRHEARHAHQWMRWGGPLPFLVAYGCASAWSYLRSGHPALANHFEVAAGLVDGGYLAEGSRPVLGLLGVPLRRGARRRGTGGGEGAGQPAE